MAVHRPTAASRTLRPLAAQLLLLLLLLRLRAPCQWPPLRQGGCSCWLDGGSVPLCRRGWLHTNVHNANNVEARRPQIRDLSRSERHLTSRCCNGAGATDASSVTLTFKPGRLGLELNEENGRVVVVNPEGQAAQLGVKVGWVLESIDGNRFSMGLVREAIRGSRPFTTVYRQPSFDYSKVMNADLAMDKISAAKEVLRREFQGIEGWESELQAKCDARMAQSDQIVGLDIREAESAGDVMGAASLLGGRRDGGREPGPFDALTPLFGLTYMRALNTVSLSAPLTVVAVADAEVVGMAEVKIDGYVRNLIVRDDWRQFGIGSQLLCWCARRSRERGANRLWMHVAADNPGGLKFYQRLNFTVGPTEPFGPENELGSRLWREL